MKDWHGIKAVKGWSINADRLEYLGEMWEPEFDVRLEAGEDVFEFRGKIADDTHDGLAMTFETEEGNKFAIAIIGTVTRNGEPIESW